MKLVDYMNTPIWIGQEIKTFRNETVTVESIHAPRHGESTGRVCCRDADGNLHEWFPGVIQAHWED